MSWRFSICENFLIQQILCLGSSLSLGASVEFIIMGFQLQSTTSEWTRLSRYHYRITRRFHSTRYLNCHTWIKETGHSEITLLLKLNYDLQNSLLIVKREADNHTQVACATAPDPTQAGKSKRLPVSCSLGLSIDLCIIILLNHWITSY